MDKLKAFESFVSVATRGSLTAAAKAEGVAPAIMGRRLDAGRAPGRQAAGAHHAAHQLTHEGSAFLEDCQRLLSDVANAEASVSAGGVKATGHLRITAPAGFGAAMWRRWCRVLRPASRGDDFAEPQRPRGGPGGRGLDCAVRVGDLPDSALVSVRMADNRRLCVATPATWRAAARRAPS
jgi:DNA-binding transcriptional LysR family regulator